MWITTDEEYQELARKLTAKYLHHNNLAVIYLPEVGSTNTWTKENLAGSRLAVDWNIIFARRQTAGRGTRGRTWVHKAGFDAAITCSMAMGQQVPDPRVSLAFGAAVALVIEEFSGRPTGIKWPNDVLLKLPEEAGGYWAKVSGILIETASGLLITGVGVNCNSRAISYPVDIRDRVTTLCDATGHSIDVCDVTERLIHRLIQVMDSIRDEKLGRWFSEWQTRDRTGGARYVLNRDGVSQEVTARRVEMSTGSLMVADDSGKEYAVSSYTELAYPTSQ